jgi:bacillithiol system protein YtxJ
MNWIKIDTKEKIAELKQDSLNERVFVLSIDTKDTLSYVMKSLLEREWAEGEMKMKTCLVDVISFKGIANDIESEFGAGNGYPKAVIIKNGKVEFEASYGKILFSEIRKFHNCMN